MKRIISTYIILPVVFWMAAAQSGCKKLIEVEPPIDEIVSTDVYGTNSTAASVLTGIYTEMIATNFYNFSLRLALSADELVYIGDPQQIQGVMYSNAITIEGDQLFWRDFYAYIFKANSAIENISASDGITPAVKKQLIAEAKFVRAFMYFYLVNLYGDAALVTTTDVKVNATAPRVDKSLIYDQIISDLKDAKADLNEEYVAADVLTPTSDRVRPNKAAATALLARAYLFSEQWALAEQESTEVISDTTSYKLEPLDNAFLRSSEEALWQLQPIGLNSNTTDAEIFVLLTGTFFSQPGPNGTSRSVYMSSQLFNDFEAGDNRKITWVDSVTAEGVTYPFAYKYKAFNPDVPRTEYAVVLRLGEQYLIRAEARAQQDKLTGANSAASDLNALRARAGLENISVSDKQEILDAVLKERRLELFTEWGHRWLDLKRTGKIDEVMEEISPLKNGVWSSYKSLFPLPFDDMRNNPSFRGHQNPGYPER